MPSFSKSTVMMNLINGEEGMMQAQSLAWSQHTFSFINSMALKCAVELAIPDAIHSNGNSVTLSELSTALSIPPSRTPCLRRLMRLLVHSGFFATRHSNNEEEEDTFSLTTLSSILVKEKRECLSPLVVMVLDQTFLKPWRSLGAWFKADEPPTAFEAAHGMGVWQATREWSELNALVNEGMASDASFTSKVLFEDCGELFRGLRSLVDVGGGTGSMARAIAEAFPEVKCVVFDLPHVVETMEASAATVEAVGGDFFKYVPPADAALLKWILHDWNDQECVEILKRCKAAIPTKEEGGKVIIVDIVMDADDVDQDSAQVHLLFDVQMMVQTTGKQRNERQWKEIFGDAGFSAYKILPILGFRSVIVVYP